MENLAEIIASGNAKKATEIANKLAEQGQWSPLASGIAFAFGVNTQFFHQFASLARDKQEAMLRAMLPYARWASERGGPWTLRWLLGSSIALGFPDTTREVAEELVERAEWRDLSTSIADAFGYHNALFSCFTTLSRDKQASMLRMLTPYARKTARHDEVLGSAYQLGCAIALNFPDIAQEIADGMIKRQEWNVLSLGIAKAFGDSKSLRRHFKKLPAKERLALWWLMLPYALKVAEHGEYKGLAHLLSYHNPAKAPTGRWVACRKFMDISTREEFLKAVVSPKLSYLRAFQQFSPEEYAGIVVAYVQAKGGITQPLLRVCSRAVEQKPELLTALVELANRYPDELLPIIHELTHPDIGGWL